MFKLDCVLVNLGRRKSLDADFLFTGENVVKNNGPVGHAGLLLVRI